MSPRDGQLPPPDHEDKPVVSGDRDAIGERLTGVSDPKDPDGLLTLDDTHPEEPDLRAGSGS